jgi:uncharacterized membrane protein YsdA (DUF1294 family)/cold shock CspA family protein
MRFSGKLTSWQDERGFGFITLTQGDEEVFLHIKMFPRSGGPPQLGEILTFDIAPSPQGKRRAVNVRRVGAAPPSLRSRNTTVTLHDRVSGLLSVAGCLGLYWAVEKVWGVPAPVALACLTILSVSLVTYTAYLIDKSAAGTTRQRVPEMALHLLSITGGWPGALLAQQMLNHKRAKREFMLMFRLTMYTHVALMLALAAYWLAGGSM